MDEKQTTTDTDTDGVSVWSESDNPPVGRRAFLRAAGAGSVAFSLAGCVQTGDDSDENGSDGDGSGNDTGGGGDDTGSGGGTSDLPETIKIGVLAPEPANNPIGGSIANAAKLAVQQLNDENFIDGTTFETVVKNTEENPGVGRDKYQELTLGEDVDVTTGIFTSEVLLAILDDIASQQVVHLTTGAATPKASQQVNEAYEKYKYHFRTGPINAYQLGVNLVDFLDAKKGDLGWNSVAVLVEDYEWTKPVSQALDELLEDTGVEIAMRQRYASGTENFTPIYDNVEESDADAAFIAMAHTGTAAVVQWAKQQRPFEFGGIHVPMQLPSYYEAVNGACNYAVTQNSATPTSEITDKTVPFSDAYNEQFGGYPVYTGYITFDAVRQYAQVLKEGGSAAADDVVSGLEQSSYTGTAGTITYYPKDHKFAHDVVYDPEKVFPLYQQWQDGTQEVIFPDELATAEYTKPKWIA